MLKSSALRFALLCVLATAFAAPARAQLPQLPNVGGTVGGVTNQLPGQVTDTVQDTVGEAQELTTRELRRARETAAQTLRRRNPTLIDVDRAGEPVIRREVVAIAPSGAALEAARAAGFSIGETVDAEGLGLSIVVLRAPDRMSTRQALERLRQLDPAGAYDYNHIYLTSTTEQRSAPFRTFQSTGRGGGGARVGLIDSGVDATHPAFSHVSLRQRGFAASEALADAHGTAVASLMVGEDGSFHGAAPGASLYVADVYGGRPTGGGATAIIAALSWLSQQGVRVINISLVGPSNRALEAGVRAAIQRNLAIVAAVGNDGPAARPLYPAAYEGVIGVTGVDNRQRVLPEAARGPQVDFAAPGADMSAAARGGYAPVRGTSYAAPIVAGLLARSSHADLARGARDLGARGRDPVFGAGLVGGDIRMARR